MARSPKTKTHYGIGMRESQDNELVVPGGAMHPKGLKMHNSHTWVQKP
jgi:hypothetical protein